MPIRTITADIGGTVRQLKADIPEGASDQEIQTAVESWASSQPRVPGMEKLGILPGLPQTRFEPKEQPFFPEPPESEQSFLTSPHGMLRSGARKVGRGAVGMMTGEPGKGATEAGLGALEMATPAMIGAGVGEFAASPLTTLARGAAAFTAGEGAKWGAHKLGAGETASNIVGAVAGLLAMRGMPKEETFRKLWRLRDNPKVQDAAVRVFRDWKGRVFPGKSQAIGELEKVLQEAEAPPPVVKTPWPAGKGTGTKYGGSYEPELQVGKSIPRKGLKPITEEMPESRSAPSTASAAIEQVPTVNTTKAASRLKESGVTKGKWESMSPKQKQDALGQAKYFGGVSQRDYKDISSALD